MKGKADKLLANRSLSALVAVCMILSVFSGILLLTNPNQTKAQAIGDLIVTSATYPGGYTIQNMEQPVKGNVVVSSGGVLTIRDGTLSVISNYDPAQRHYVDIAAGGTVVLEHGTITTYLDQIDPWPFLTFIVQNGGVLTASGNSVLMFPGDLIIDNGAEVTLYDTSIVALPGSMVDQFAVGASGLITIDSANDGPAISITDASLSLFDSVISDFPEYPSDLLPASNLTIDGASTLLAVNSYIGVDFGPALDMADWYTHNVIVLSGTSVAHLYGCSFEEYAGEAADRAAAITASGESYAALPLTKGGEDTTGQLLSALEKSNEGMTYHVGPGERMAIDSFDTGGAAVLSGATLLVKYQVDPGYNGVNFITYSTNEGATKPSTGIRPLASETSAVEKSFDLFGAGVTTIAALNTLDIDFTHSGTVGDVQLDSMSIMISIGAEAYIYRWLNVTVGDEYGVPIPDAEISSVFTGSSSFDGQPVFYFGPDGAQPLPPDSVLDYMGVDASTFSTTESNGIAIIPYLTDMVSGDQSPNSLFVGSISITGTATIETVVYSSSESFSFVAYPAMSSSDQYADVTVEVAGISAPSPDPSRWLVVPISADQLSLVIEDLTYYHAGDVIVAANGTLTISNAEFVVVQVFNNQRTIYIDSPEAYPAKLMVENSKMTSDLAVDIIVKGFSTLEVVDSVMEGVNIVASENSNVILRNVSMDGTITTTWDSHASVKIYDANLVVSPVLSGYAVGEFTNSSVPSVIVEDNAVGMIYRWIHVTVFDGAGYPLPGADVTANYYVNNTFAGAAQSSASPTELGVAKVNALATLLTATGSQFVGNYRVNATYTAFDGQVYNATKNISVGVLPYTEPLGRNATYATMTIPEALPDLTVHQTPVPVVTNPTNPKKGGVTQVTATVHNDGPVPAYNVRVDFYDVNNLTMPVLDEAHMESYFATVFIPSIAPNSSADAVASWTAGKPLSPDTHNLTVIVDRLNATPELDDTMAIGWGLVTVKNLPDIRISSGASGIYASTSYVENGTLVTLYAVVYNDGDSPAYDVTVQFWDGGVLLDEDVVDYIAPMSAETASITWVFTTVTPHTIYVIGNPDGILAFEELSYSNNQGSRSLDVFEHPDLMISDPLFYLFGNNTYISIVPGGSIVNITAKLRNLNKLPVANPVVRLYVNSSLGAPLIPTRDITVNGIMSSEYYSTLTVTFVVNLPFVDATEPYEVKMIVNPTRSVLETSYGNNQITGTLTIRDVRPDFMVTHDNIHIFNSQNSPIQSQVFGRSLKIVVTVTNLGLTGASGVPMAMGLYNLSTEVIYTFSLTDNTFDIGAAGTPTASVNVTHTYVLNISIPGEWMVWAEIDPNQQVADESDRTNNMALTNFTVNKLVCKVNIFTSGKEFKAGGTIVVTANVMYEDNGEMVPNLPDGSVMFYLAGASGAHTRWPGGQSPATNSTNAGIATATIMVPADIDTGSYIIEAVILGDSYYDATGASPQQIHISAAGGEGLFPLWVWILIIVAVVGVVAGFTVYTYVYGLGKLVECGECGAFIPAASKRCPKCGVEFEPGTMKCSECGAWIPAESTECPNCGVKFIGEAEEEGDYLDRMKKEYEEMRSQFRELAKAELGKKFSDKQFEFWWKSQPTYISFEDWLAKEEEKKKEGPVPCPVCGTLNPKEATVCHKCGTVFGVQQGGPGRKGPPPGAEGGEEEVVVTDQRAGTQAQMQQPVGQPRMVIRRPIEKRVVPKKIIKTPVGGEGAEGDQNQENQ